MKNITTFVFSALALTLSLPVYASDEKQEDPEPKSVAVVVTTEKEDMPSAISVPAPKSQDWAWSNYFTNSLKALTRNEETEKATFPDLTIGDLIDALKAYHNHEPKEYKKALWDNVPHLRFSYQTPAYPGGTAIIVGCDYGKLTGLEKDPKPELHRISTLYKYDIRDETYHFLSEGVPKVYDYLEEITNGSQDTKFRKLGIKYASTEHTLTGMEYFYSRNGHYMILAAYRTKTDVPEALINQLRAQFLQRKTIY